MFEYRRAGTRAERRQVILDSGAGLLKLLKRLVLLLHQADCRGKHLVINAFRKSDISHIPVVAKPVFSGTL